MYKLINFYSFKLNEKFVKKLNFQNLFVSTDNIKQSIDIF